MDGLIIQSKNKLSEAEQQQMHFPVYDGINYNRSGSYPWANVRGMSIIVSNSWALLWMNLWEMAVTGEEKDVH